MESLNATLRTVHHGFVIAFLDALQEMSRKRTHFLYDQLQTDGGGNLVR
jgi:hypothetical protein